MHTKFVDIFSEFYKTACLDVCVCMTNLFTCRVLDPTTVIKPFPVYLVEEDLHPAGML